MIETTTHNAVSENYQITVEGKLDKSWSSRMAGLAFNHSEIDTKIITTLTGKIIDQAELNGVLNTLYNNRMKVISVNKIS